MSAAYLTKRELAIRLRISTRTIERLHLPHTRVGGQNRYQFAECLHALSGQPASGDNVVELRPRHKETAA